MELSKNHRIDVTGFELKYIVEALSKYDGESMWDTMNIMKLEDRLKEKLG